LGDVYKRQLQNSKVVVVNKFSTVDMKVVSLLQILETMEVDEDLIQEKLKPFYHNIKQTHISLYSFHLPVLSPPKVFRL
ncbi:hypothetical protein ACQ4LD_21500, partial [Sphingobacterium daejeonense]